MWACNFSHFFRPVFFFRRFHRRTFKTTAIEFLISLSLHVYLSASLSSAALAWPTMQSAEITLWCPAGLSRRHLSVQLDPSHDRCKTQSVCEEQIGRTWDSRVAANPSLYNGAKFRLAGNLPISHHVLWGACRTPSNLPICPPHVGKHVPKIRA